MAGDVEDVAVALRRDHPDGRAVVLDDDVRGDRRAVEHLVERRGALAGPRGELADPGHRALRGILGRGGQLVHEHRPGLVVDVDEVGERAADVDADALHDATSGGEDDLAEELPALHEVHRLLRLLEGERRGHLRLQLAAGDEPEARLGLAAVEDERADHRQLSTEERDHVEGHDLARMGAADDEPPVLGERVEALLEQLAADVLVDDVDAVAVRDLHHHLGHVLASCS